MADTKISALTAVAAVLAAQEFAVNDAGASKKATALQIKTWMNGLAFLGRTKLGADATDITVSFTAQDGLFFLLSDIVGYSGAGGIARWRPNGDTTTTNYSSTSSEPINAASTATINAGGIILGETAQTTSRSPVFTILQKASSADIGWFVSIGGDGSRTAGVATDLIGTTGLWVNSSSISSIVLNGGGVNLLNGSWVEVYGIKNAAST